MPKKALANDARSQSAKAPPKFFRKEVSPSKVTRNVVSKMPVVVPSTDIDFKLRTVAPDESVDHKLVIESPEIEASK